MIKNARVQWIHQIMKNESGAGSVDQRRATSAKKTLHLNMRDSNVPIQIWWETVLE